MRLSLDNFLYAIKQIVTGKNGAGTGNAQAADGGIKVDVPLPLTALTLPSTQFPAITDSTGGAASATFAAITPNAAITDSTGGTPSTTFAAITAPGANATTSLTADMTAVKNALSETAAELNAIRTALTAVTNMAAESAVIFNAMHAANNTIATGKVPAYTVASGVAPTVGIVSFPIPRDYDAASDHMKLRLKIALANADAAITITGTPTIVPLGGAAATGAAVSGTSPFKTTAVNLSTTEQLVEIDFSGNGLTRDDLIAVTLALVGTTTGNTNITGIEWHYDSTIVSYNETDSTGTDGSLREYGNPLR